MLDLENLNKKVDKFFNQFKDIDSEISHKLHTSYWEEQSYTNIPEHIVIYCFNGFFVTIYRRFRTNFMSFVKRVFKSEFNQDDYLFTFKVEKDGFEIKNLPGAGFELILIGIDFFLGFAFMAMFFFMI